MTSRKQELEAKLSKVAGTEIEITVRGEREFTFSFEGKCEAAVAAVRQFFGGMSHLTESYDEECDFTCIYAAV